MILAITAWSSTEAEKVNESIFERTTWKELQSTNPNVELERQWDTIVGTELPLTR
jgi:hypothetical protein